MALKKKKVTKRGAKKNIVIETNKGQVTVELLSSLAPNHCKRILQLSKDKFFDDVVFHRVIDGFMAQTGDVQFGKTQAFNPELVGRGGSSLPDLPSEFSDMAFVEGTVGMARSNNPDSANSQFFIMFQPAPHLDNNYTVFGTVSSGMDVLSKIKKGDLKGNGAVDNPDFMKKVYLDK